MGMTTGLIDDFTEELLFEDELAPKTVHDVLVVLHGILKYTATFFTGGFPAIEINYPKPGKKEMRVLSREEQTCFVSYLLDDMDTCKFGVLLTLFTGVRIGELCALQWGNINTDVGCASGVIRSLEKDQVSGLCVCWGNIGAYLPQPLRAQTAKAPAEAAVVVDV